MSVKKTQIYIRTKKKCGYQNKNSKDKINSRLDPKSSELRISREMDTQNLVLSDNEIIFNIVVNRHGRYLRGSNLYLVDIPKEEDGGNDGGETFRD